MHIITIIIIINAGNEVVVIIMVMIMQPDNHHHHRHQCSSILGGYISLCLCIIIWYDMFKLCQKYQNHHGHCRTIICDGPNGLPASKAQGARAKTHLLGGPMPIPPSSPFELSKKGGWVDSLVDPGGARSGTSIEWNPKLFRMEGLTYHNKSLQNGTPISIEWNLRGSYKQRHVYKMEEPVIGLKSA
jgi:hypothetical protein